MTDTCEVCGRPKSRTPEDGGCFAWSAHAEDLVRVACYRRGYTHVLAANTLLRVENAALRAVLEGLPAEIDLAEVP